MTAAPLVSKEVILGTITVFMLSRERVFSDRDLRMLVGVGRLAGVAIENAKLFASEHREREILSILETLSKRALTLVDVDEFLQAIVESATKTTTICCAAILLVEDGWLTVRPRPIETVRRPAAGSDSVKDSRDK